MITELDGSLLPSETLSPSMSPHHSDVSVMFHQSNQDITLHGLGLIAGPDPSHFFINETERPLQIVHPIPKRPRKRRKLLKAKVPPSPSRTKEFPCTYCQSSFDRQSNLTTHLKVHGITKARMITCSEPGCTKSYGRVSDANRHAKSAHSGKNYPCGNCGRGYSRNDMRCRHMSSGCTGRRQ